jgi:hypothetical protein
MYVGNNKVYRKDGTKVIMSEGKHLNINAAWMIVHAPFATTARIPKDSIGEVTELLERRKLDSR